jgi:hypothetical protein
MAELYPPIEPYEHWMPSLRHPADAAAYCLE